MKQLIILTYLVIVQACNSNSGYNNSNVESSVPGVAMREQSAKAIDGVELSYDQKGNDQADAQEIASKIIKNGYLKFEVSSIQKARTYVDTVVSKYQAYYENDNYHTYNNIRNNTLKIRVPNDKFDGLIQALENQLGKLVNKNIQLEDVTEQYVDIEIRLKNKLSYLEQYQSILKKANTVEDILEVQEKIRVLEEEIEAQKGRLRYLDSKVNYSTLNLELTEYNATSTLDKPSFFKRIGLAVQNGVQLLQYLILGIISSWPLLLLFGLIGWIVRRYLKKKK